MELRTGYKQTDVGFIPEDWDIAALGEVVEFLDGKRRPVKDSDRAKMRGIYPYYGASGIVDYVSDYLFDEDLILLGEDGENILSRNLPLAFRVSGKIWVNNHAHVLRPTKRTDIGYLTEYLESIDYSNFNTGTAQPKLNKKSCAFLKIVLPPIAEQRAIAGTLSDMDTLISSLGALVKKKRALKQATMQELLTGKMRLMGFNADWRRVRLQDCSANITKGSTPTTYGFGWESTGVIFLRSECVSEVGLNLQQAMYISSHAHQMLRRSEIRGGDILITITGNVGRVVLLSDEFSEANINQHIARVRINPEIMNRRFVYYVLSQPEYRMHYSSITTGQAYPQLSLVQIRETQVPLPGIKEQTAIAAILSDMDADLAALEFEREKICALKQGLVQQLLTGKIRLK